MNGRLLKPTGLRDKVCILLIFSGNVIKQDHSVIVRNKKGEGKRSRQGRKQLST